MCVVEGRDNGGAKGFEAMWEFSDELLLGEAVSWKDRKIQFDYSKIIVTIF